MPQTDLGPGVIILNFSEAYIQKQFKLDASEANLYKLCRAVYNGFLKESGDVLDVLEPQRFAYTATEGFLDHHADFWNVPRVDGETDGALRLRIGLAKLIQWGAFNIDDMLVLLATLLNVQVSDIEFDENLDESEAFEPALIRFYISPNIFEDNGVDDIPAAVADLEAKMEQVAPAGVRVIVSSSGTAQYDNGDLWDNGETYS